MDLNSLLLIDKIASLGSFTAAAKAAGIPNSNLSWKIKQLEQELGQSLFVRTTRKVVITAFGQRVREKLGGFSAIEEEIKNLAEEAAAEPTGTIKVSAPHDVGLYLCRYVLPGFAQCYPGIQVMLDLSSRFVNLMDEGYDFAIRASSKALPDSSNMAIKLAHTELKLFAAAAGVYAGIKKIEDLRLVPIVTYDGKQVKLKNGEQSYVPPIQSNLMISDMSGVKQAILGGLGIGILPSSFQHGGDSKVDSLKEILPMWTAGKADIFAISAGRHYLTRKNRLFLDHLKSCF